VADPAPEALGVGIDVEDRDALDHLTDAVIHRATARWLDAGEQAWCQAQPSARESLIVALVCKEAAYKAGRGAGGPAGVRLALEGSLERGRAIGRDRSVTVEVEWRGRGTQVVAVALAFPSPPEQAPHPADPPPAS
jgi:hypothetical protein